MQLLDKLNSKSKPKLPGYLGMEVTHVGDRQVTIQFDVCEHHMAPNGFLHAGAVVTLADSACGNGCMLNLPEGAAGFTTVELKSNHLGTATEGTVICTAKPSHMGRTTQVWDAVVTHEQTGKTIALFRCTQMILYP